MANSKNNGSFDADARYVEFLGDKLVDLTNKFEAMSNTLKNTIDLENKNRNIVSNKLAMSSKEIDNAFKMAKGIAEKFGRTTAFNASLEGARASVHKLALSGHNIQEERLLVYLENFLSKHVAESKKAIERGEEPTLKKVDLKSYKPIIEEIEKKLGVKGALTGVQNKLMAFFGDMAKETDKKRKRMVDDLIEGLASSKFIGGVLSDTFKLIGLMGASWLSHFGQLGRILGGAFYVAMSAFGPTLTKLLVERLGKVFWSGLKFISSTIWKAVTSQALRQGAGNLIYSMSKGGVSPALQLITGTGAEKASAIAKIGGLGLAAGAGFIGAKWAGGEAADSWRQGRKGNAVAIGAGAGLLGAGALAALGAIFVPALAPFVAPLLGIGAAVTVISKLWKEYSETIKKIAKPVGEFIKKALEFFWIMSPIGLLFKGLKAIIDRLTGGGSNNPSENNNIPWMPGGGGPDRPKGSRFYDERNAKAFGKLKLAPDGSILNFHELTQAEGSAALQEYEKQSPKTFGNLYEWIDPKYAQERSFRTDKVKIVDGKKVGILGYKGETEDLLGARAVLEGSPTLKGKGKSLILTGGVGSKGGPHGVPKLMQNWFKSHYNQYGEAMDMVGGSDWSMKDYYTALQVLKGYYGKKGFEVNYENPNGKFANTLETMKPGGHFDIKRIKDGRPEGAVKNLAEATKHSVEVEKALKEANDSANTVDQYRDKKMNAQERASVVESVMKKQGFKYDDKQKTWVKPAPKNDTVSFLPPTGNDDFLAVQQNLSTFVMYGGNQERIG